MIGSLVAYKGRYAQILSIVDGKFEIKVENNIIKKVREKDFRLLSPTFKTPTIKLIPELEILTELEEELLSIHELSEWLFGEYTAHSSWQTFLLVENGLYFFWQKDKIFVRPASQVKKIKIKRELEQKEEQLLDSCIKNLNNNTFEKDDLPIIKEIEKVALGIIKSTKILKKIHRENTPQKAHELLVNIGYFDLLYNPYPARHRILLEEQVEISPLKRNDNVVDLTHFKSYAIDNFGSTDADDAISINGKTIWIHIADVIGFSGGSLLEYAGHRVSNLFLPNEVINMLPKSVTAQCALGVDKVSQALSIGFEYSDNFKNITNIQIIRSKINVKKIDYDTVDNNKNVFQDYLNIANQHKNYRLNQGSFSLDLPKVDVKVIDGKVQLYPQKNTNSRLMVAEFMILAGRVIAQFSADNDIPMPFVSQEKGDFGDKLLKKKILTLSESFASTKLFKKSVINPSPAAHFGLGLDKYIRITSPLRRYLDLVAHFQLYNFIQGAPLLTNKQIKESITLNNIQSGNNLQASKASNMHYKLLYLLRHKNTTYKASVLRNMSEKKMIIITELSLVSIVKSSAKIDTEIIVKVTHIDIFNQEFSVKEVL